MSGLGPALSRKFDLNKNILGVNASQTIEVSVATDVDVIEALTSPNPQPPPFPDREISLGSIDLKAEAGKELAFNAGAGKVSFSASGGFKAGAGVFNDAGKAVAALNIEMPDGFGFGISSPNPERYIVMQWGWNVSVSAEGSHPIGALGKLTFGGEVKQDRLYAVIHGFAPDNGARASLADTVNSWVLPRHLVNASITPRTWIVAEAEGSIGGKAGAQLGYDFKLSREAKLLGISRQLSARIDAKVEAEIGFSVSGRYLIVAGRESDKNVLRLRLFRKSTRDLDIGLNLSAGVQNTTPLPAKADDFVKGILGVHGIQVMKDLARIEQWLNSNDDLSRTVARLSRDTGLKLLRETTGIDAEHHFNEARDAAADLIKKWNSLPDKVASAVWTGLERLDDQGAAGFKTFLENLASDDSGTARKALTDAVQHAIFGDSAQGRFLAALTDTGLLALSEQLDQVRHAASEVLGVLNGDKLRKLQKFINTKLDITQLENIVTKADFDTASDWLVARFSDFLDEKLGFDQLQQMKNTVQALLGMRQKVYEQIKNAASKRYGAELAVHYHRMSANTALIDAEFDLDDPAAKTVFKDVIENGRFDQLLLQAGSLKGVTLHQGVLTHQISRVTSIDIHLPHWSRQQQTILESIAKVKAEGDGDRVLVYEVDSKSTVTVANRFKSQMAVLAGIRESDGRFVADGSISYELRLAKADMRFADLEHTVTPFLSTYFGSVFSTPQSSIHTFLFELDRTVEDIVHNGPNEFGDVALSMQLAAPARLLTSWFRQRTDEQLKADMMTVSRHLQARLRHILPFYFFQDMDTLFQNPTTAALLVWSSLPVSTSVAANLTEGKLTFNTDKDIFWDFPNVQLRRAMALDSHTSTGLASRLAPLQTRLREAGENRRADTFDPSQFSSFQSLTFSDIGATLYESLLFTEANLIGGVERCLKNIQKFTRNQSSPSQAVAALAEFGAQLVKTFNTRLGVYGSNALRPLGSMILAETAAALEGSMQPEDFRAVLSLAVLREQRSFKLGDFAGGAVPPDGEIALTQTLAS